MRKPLIRRAFTAATTTCIAVAAFVLSATPAAAADGEIITDNLSAIPVVRGPIAETADSHMWSTMKRARVPLDLAAHGFVEEEFFLSGTANIYDHVDGKVSVRTEDVPYVNHILVRRPASAADASGVVLVDVFNASNGFPGEDHWRRMWEWALQEGHTIIGVTSKPIQIDALHNFDAERYSDLTWDVGSEAREPIIADPANPSAFNPHMTVEGAEEGLVWDIITQLGVLLAQDPGRIVGDLSPTTKLLLGQSQSGLYVNTYAANFHTAQAEANGTSVWDGYLNSVGGTAQRPLAQGSTPIIADLQGFDVPFITVTSEGDTGLFGTSGLTEQTLPENRYHWQVPATPHTDLLSTVIPADEEIYRAGRLPNTQVHDAAFRAALNPYPLEPAIIAAAESLIAAAQRDAAIPDSVWFEQVDGALVRDDLGNAVGGLRYGLLKNPLGQYLGAATPGAVYGSVDLMSAEEFAVAYGTREAYLALMAATDSQLIDAGYLTEYGAQYLRGVAETLLDRIGAPTRGAGEPGTDDPGTGQTDTADEPLASSGGESVVGALAAGLLALIAGAGAILFARTRNRYGV